MLALLIYVCVGITGATLITEMWCTMHMYISYHKIYTFSSINAYTHVINKLQSQKHHIRLVISAV